MTASGRSREWPRENLLYVVQIWCPAADHDRLAEPMDELLDTVRVTDRVFHDGDVLRLYPETTAAPPDLPSPWWPRTAGPT